MLHGLVFPARTHLLNSHRSPSGPPRAYIVNQHVLYLQKLQIHLIQADKIGFTESEEVKIK